MIRAASGPQVVLITGCSSGFGLLTAARLAQRGHRVFATMRDPDKKGPLLEKVAKRAAAVEVLPLNVTDVESVENAVYQVQEKTGRIDVLINNAGYAMGGAFEDLTQEEIRAQLETNFFGVQNLVRETLPLMRAQGSGTIINISSVAGLYALPGLGAYNASKWALEGFSESLYYEVKPFGIRICLIEPGSYRTKIFFENRRVAARASDPSSPYFSFTEKLKTIVDETVAQDRKDPEEIAALVERLINSSNPPFRNIPDMRSRILFTLRRFLPWPVFSGMVYRAIRSCRNSSRSLH
jgi:NAD(P)-dependent dehydrogenase (short-subunit alcohol dehydrogenase family)